MTLNLLLPTLSDLILYLNECESLNGSIWHAHGSHGLSNDIQTNKNRHLSLFVEIYFNLLLQYVHLMTSQTGVYDGVTLASNVIFSTGIWVPFVFSCLAVSASAALPANGRNQQDCAGREALSCVDIRHRNRGWHRIRFAEKHDHNQR